MREHQTFLRSQKGWCHLELAGTGLFLDVSGQRLRRGASLVVWPKTRGYNQIWRHDPQTGALQSRWPLRASVSLLLLLLLLREEASLRLHAHRRLLLMFFCRGRIFHLRRAPFWPFQFSVGLCNP